MPETTFCTEASGTTALNGGLGHDILVGGKGNDNLTGGAGNDVFRWEFSDAGTKHHTSR
jgi:Ca2+-binding RTX toxin-like protein